MESSEKEFVNDISKDLKDLPESALFIIELASDASLKQIIVQINAYNIMRRRLELLKKTVMNLRYAKFGGR